MQNIDTTQVSVSRSSGGSTRLRLTRRGRRALLAVLACPAIVAGAFSVAQVTSAEAGTTAASVQFETLTVHSGETLWEIAQELAPNDDPRDVIYELQTLNEISGAVQAGTTLLVPPQYTN